LIHAIIVDDEQDNLEYLEFILKKNESIFVAGAYNSGQEALDAIKGMEIDIAFLDIDMPEIDGLTLADMILDINPEVSVVFVTAHNQYAVEAFRLNALDYVLKPISRDRINETLQRFVKGKKTSLKSSKIMVCCFGGFIVSSMETKESVKWQTSKSEELFAYLVSKEGHDVTFENINTDIFPDMDYERAYSNMRTTIYKIKKTLGKMGINGVIKSVRGAYSIVPDTLECDYYKLIHADSHQNAVCEENAVYVEGVISSYKGGFLENHGYLWAEKQRQALEYNFINLSMGLCEYFQSLSNYRGAEKYLKKIIKFSPVYYPANKRLIEVYLQMHDKVYALKTFDSYKRRLKEEFGELPPKEMSSLLF
jgi:two-component SAPR family response regulator